MRPDQFREAHKETAQEVRSPGDFAKRVPRSPRRRNVRKLVVAGVVAAGVAAGVAVTLAMDGDGTQARPAGEVDTPDAVAHPDQSPPRELIAAGKVALSAYYTQRAVKQPNGDGIVTYEWSLLNAATKRYEQTNWAWLDVAPGMQTAAVLERDLPVNRIGLLNLTTGKVGRWIEVDKSVGSVEFSPDGKHLVATTYSLNPDGLFKDALQQVNDKKLPGPKPSRTGFYVIDVASGQADFTVRPRKKDDRGITDGGRQDFSWNHDGELLWEPWRNQAGKIYFDRNGKEMPVPKQEAYLSYPEAGLSPDGGLVAGTMTGEDGQIVSEVLDAKTGERAALVPGQQLVAWADNNHLIAWHCDPEQCAPGKGEFRNQLLLVGLDSKKVTPLSGFREADLNYDGRWTPVFTER
ncbi:hypothetical protein ACIHCQ_38920 [Streptomyces sp. NPDC052236]|uniref:hypothetical protein n=1 Tax=Streptomyces sp. NPDC052236 TaxID=3365686 RepID=UPI0037D63898